MTDLNVTEWKLIDELSRMPFIDREELALLSDIEYNGVCRALPRLVREGLVSSVQHATPETAPSARLYLTRRGVRLYLSRALVPLSRIDRPISREWYRRLLRRLDCVRTVYRIARSFVPADTDIRRNTPRVYWFRDGTWDAALRFNDGNVVPIMFHGEASRRSRFMERLVEFNDHHKRRVPGVLIVAPDLFSANKSLFKLRSLDSSITAYACVEPELGTARSEQRIWLGMRFENERFDSHELLRSFGGRGGTIEQRPVKRAGLPWTQIPEDLLVWSALKRSAKRYFSIIGKCPLIRVDDLRNIAGVKLGMHRTNMAALAQFDLVSRHEIGGESRVSRSDEGLRLIAYRDRMNLTKGLLNKRSSSLLGDGKFRGSQIRQAARTLRHNDTVHMLIGLFAQHAREEKASFEFEVAQHLHRRYVDYRNRQRQLSPDAQVSLFGTDYFYIEVEFTAGEISSFRDKLRPYLWYFASRKWRDDLRVEPTVLFVMKDAVTARAFLRVAHEECRREGVYPALGVADMETVEREMSVSEAVWLTRASLRSGIAYQLAGNRHFSA